MPAPEPSVVGLGIVDDPAAWRAIGFDVGPDGTTTIGSVNVHIADEPDGRGIRTWSFDRPWPPDVDGLATTPAPVPAPAMDHPNGVAHIDHLVIASPDWRRTVDALDSAGLTARRTRTFDRGGIAQRQVFFRAGEVIVELSTTEEATGDGPTSFWGLALTVADLDALVEHLGELVTTPVDAVQPGRRICAVRADRAGTAVPIAFMTPHLRGEAHRSVPFA